MKATIEVNGQSREIEVWVSPSQITVWVTPDKYLSIDRACGLVTENPQAPPFRAGDKFFKG